MARGEATPARRSTRAAASAPTPRTTRRAAAASAAAASDEEEEQPQAVAPRTTRRRAAAKKAAEPPPEPEALTEPEPEAEEQAAETPPPPRGTPRRRSAAADKAAFRAAAATPLTKSRGPSPAPRPPIGAVGSPLFLLLLLAAAGSLAAYFARPFCQQRDCGELLRNLPDLAVESAAGSYGVLRERALAAAYALQAHASTAVQLIRGSVKGAASGCRLDATAALKAIMPAGQEFAGLQAAAVAALSGGGADVDGGPAVALLVCEAAASCGSALEAVEAAVPDAAACVLQLEAAALGEDVEGLHAQVAAFLNTSPSGVVAINRVDKMPPALLSMLVEATAEGGSVMGADGELVGTAGATFILTAWMPAEVFASLHEEARFQLAAKNQLVVDLALRAPGGRKDEVADLAKTLRRRISAVVPLSGDPLGGAGDAAGTEAGECLLDGEALVTRLLPAGPAWEAVREVAAAVLGPERPHAGHEPPALLFACDDDEACEAAARQARRSTAGGRGCVLVLEGSQMGSLGELQEAVAAFLRDAPAGVVVVSRLDQLEPELLAVLVDALSYDGEMSAGADADPVPTAGATFLLTMLMPPSVFMHAANDAFFLQDAQLQVLADFRDRAVDKGAAVALVEALLERIDALLPVGSLAAASTARDVARHTQQPAVDAVDAEEAAAASEWGDQAEFEVHAGEPVVGDPAAEEQAEESDGSYGSWAGQEAVEEVTGETGQPAAPEEDPEFGSLEEALQYAADLAQPGQEPHQEPDPADGDEGDAAAWEEQQEQPAEEEWNGEGEEAYEEPAQGDGGAYAEREDLVAEAVLADQ